MMRFSHTLAAFWEAWKNGSLAVLVILVGGFGAFAAAAVPVILAATLVELALGPFISLRNALILIAVVAIPFGAGAAVHVLGAAGEDREDEAEPWW
jgi:hypothetical protein